MIEEFNAFEETKGVFEKEFTAFVNDHFESKPSLDVSLTEMWNPSPSVVEVVATVKLSDEDAYDVESLLEAIRYDRDRTTNDENSTEYFGFFDGSLGRCHCRVKVTNDSSYTQYLDRIREE